MLPDSPPMRVLRSREAACGHSCGAIARLAQQTEPWKARPHGRLRGFDASSRRAFSGSTRFALSLRAGHGIVLGPGPMTSVPGRPYRMRSIELTYPVTVKPSSGPSSVSRTKVLSPSDASV